MNARIKAQRRRNGDLRTIIGQAFTASCARSTGNEALANRLFAWLRLYLWAQSTGLWAASADPGPCIHLPRRRAGSFSLILPDDIRAAVTHALRHILLGGSPQALPRAAGDTSGCNHAGWPFQAQEPHPRPTLPICTYGWRRRVETREVRLTSTLGHALPCARFLLRIASYSQQSVVEGKRWIRQCQETAV